MVWLWLSVSALGVDSAQSSHPFPFPARQNAGEGDLILDYSTSLDTVRCLYGAQSTKDAPTMEMFAK